MTDKEIVQALFPSPCGVWVVSVSCQYDFRGLKVAEDLMQDTYVRFRQSVQSYKSGNPAAFLIDFGNLAMFESRHDVQHNDLRFVGGQHLFWRY